MEKVILNAENRQTTGKKVELLRRSGKLPAIIYGKEIETQPITLNARETTNILNKITGSTIITINLEGEEHATLVREIQRDFIKNEIIHLDFQAISLKEKLRTHVPISLVGAAPVLKEFNAIIVSGINEVEVECLPQDLPEHIEVDVSHLEEIGAAIYLKDITPPENVEFISDPEELVAVISAVKEEAVVEEEVVPEVEGVEEPEVIEHGKVEEEDIEEK